MSVEGCLGLPSVFSDIFDLCFSESLMSVKMFARNSGARNGCASFMGAWGFLVLSAGKPRCP